MQASMHVVGVVVGVGRGGCCCSSLALSSGKRWLELELTVKRIKKTYKLIKTSKRAPPAK